MSIDDFVDFVNSQRDPRLNEILFPYCNTEKAQDLIAKYEPNHYNVKVIGIHSLSFRVCWEG